MKESTELSRDERETANGNSRALIANGGTIPVFQCKYDSALVSCLRVKTVFNISEMHVSG
jgi:hypothetical protein